MPTTTLKLLLAAGLFLFILLAGYLPFKQRGKQDHHTAFPIGETLATGVFLGVALLHMLPESAKLFGQQGYEYPLAYLIVGVVFLLFLWFEHLAREIWHHKDHSHPAFALVAWFMLSIHSIMLGAALGLSADYPVVIMLFLAIVTHKWAESFAISVQLNKSALSRSLRVVLFASFAFMTPLGIGIGLFAGSDGTTGSLFDPVLIAASAGTFLYLGTLHGLDQGVMIERCCNLRDFSFVITGFGLMALVAMYV